MKRQLEAEMAGFADEVHRFIQAYWPAGAQTRSSTDVQAWRQALVDAGWSVPGWPQVAGGTGWDATQMYIWRQACAEKGVPESDDVGVDVVGPWLLAHGTVAQRDRFLADIITLRSRWCIGFMEPQAGSDLAAMTTTVQRHGHALHLSGCKNFVHGAAEADYICCVARWQETDNFALFIVDMHTPGIQVAATPMLDGGDVMAEVTFNQVLLAEDSQLGPLDDGSAFASFLLSSEFSTLARSALAQAQLDLLDAVIKEFAPDDDIHRKRHEVAVALDALKAMELRYVDALQRGVQPPFSLILLRLKSLEILLQLGALQVESFGYYALPYPDELLLHNEGPIGPSSAAAIIRRTLTQQLIAIYEGSAEALKDQAWRNLGHIR